MTERVPPAEELRQILNDARVRHGDLFVHLTRIRGEAALAATQRDRDPAQALEALDYARAFVARCSDDLVALTAAVAKTDGCLLRMRDEAAAIALGSEGGPAADGAVTP